MKIEETDLLKFQLLTANVTIATQARDAFAAALVRKYGESGDTDIKWAPDGTIMRASSLTSIPETQAPGG